MNEAKPLIGLVTVNMFALYFYSSWEYFIIYCWLK